jgi:stage III sporulation protein SpoIIIAA
MEKRVVIIDTSNEIAGDSDFPNAGIGRARRIQVSRTEYQQNVINKNNNKAITLQTATITISKL